MISRVQVVRITIMVAFVLIFHAVAFSQKADSLATKKPTRNTIGIQISFHEFFTALPGVRPSWRIADIVSHPSVGLEFLRNLNANNGLIFSVRYYIGGKNHIVTDSPCSGAGQIDQRQMGLFELDYLRHLLSYKHLELRGIAGLNFRLGHELIVSCNPQFWEGDGRPLRDLGITIGLRGMMPMGKRLQIAGEFKFTEYLYRRGGYFNPWYTNFARHGSTRHMLTLQFGLGYCF